MAYLRVRNDYTEVPVIIEALRDFFSVMEISGSTEGGNYWVSNLLLARAPFREADIRVLIKQRHRFQIVAIWEKNAWGDMNYYVSEVLKNEDSPGLGFWVDMRNEHGHWVLFSIPKSHERAVELIMWLDDHKGTDIYLPELKDLEIDHFLKLMDEKKQAQLAWINNG